MIDEKEQQHARKAYPLTCDCIHCINAQFLRNLLPWSECYGRPEHLKGLHEKDRITRQGAEARQRAFKRNPALRLGW